MKIEKIKTYPSDIAREQFEHVRPMLESCRKKTKPRTVDLYDVFNGALYILRTGCQWRALPSEYPNWKTVHSYFTLWSEQGGEKDKNSLLGRCLKKIGWRGPLKTGAEIGNELFNR